MFLTWLACAAPEAPSPAAPGPVSTAGLAHQPRIPPACYTRTTLEDGRVVNPCYVCHHRGQEPNYVDDSDLQLTYAFPSSNLVNPWTNLYADRSAAVAAISDDEVRRYVREDNYATRDPSAWDVDGDGAWSGYLPDAAFSFDARGFDLGPDGPTGWRALAYAPLPGSFLPVNGSADDVLVRLPAPWREGPDGLDLALYAVNLAILEAALLRRDVGIPPTDERPLEVDLDRDGVFGTATRITWEWDPLAGRSMSWVGRARGLPVVGGLYPVGAELLHTVRYLDVDGDTVGMAPRLKELRYMRKTEGYTWAQLLGQVLDEAKEAAEDPDRPEPWLGDPEGGLENGRGWVLQGFIEDREGALRPQTMEETAFCLGCHGGLGVTTDHTFAFARKLPGEGGWYHWSQRPLSLGDLGPFAGEYHRYRRLNASDDELRRTTGEAVVLWPDPSRALELDKAYWLLVREQAYARGRDPVVRPATGVHERVASDAPTGITVPESPGP